MKKFSMTVTEEFYPKSMNSLLDRKNDPKLTKKLTTTEKNFILSSSNTRLNVDKKKSFSKNSTPANLSKNIVCEIDFNGFYYEVDFRKNQAFKDLNKEIKKDTDSDSFIEFKKTIWLDIGKMYSKCKEDYKLRKGDIIKLGNVTLKILDLKGSPSEDKIVRKIPSSKTTMHNITNITNNATGLDEKSQNSSINGSSTRFIGSSTNLKKFPKIVSSLLTPKSQIPICRICLGEENTEKNPLVSPCECKGTMKYIHLYCLRKYYAGKISIYSSRKSAVTKFAFNSVKCELCNAEFEEKIVCDKQEYLILEIPHSESNYIIMELKSCTDGNYIEEHVYYVLSFDNIKALTAGRSPFADWCIDDCTISRFHCQITLEEGDFYLSDFTSKHGTFVNLGTNNRIELLLSQPLCLCFLNYYYIFKVYMTITEIICVVFCCTKKGKISGYNEYFDKINKNKKYVQSNSIDFRKPIFNSLSLNNKSISANGNIGLLTLNSKLCKSSNL